MTNSPPSLTTITRRTRFPSSTRLSRLGLYASLSVLACQTASPIPAHEAPHPKPPGKTPDESSRPVLPTPSGKAVYFEDEVQHLTSVRGLPERHPVHGLLVNSDDLVDHVKRALAHERPPAVMLGTEAMLVGLGLVPPDFDFETVMLSLLSENLAGLYEPRLKLMMIRADLPEQAAQITLFHELVHALQDQHYDLSEIVTAKADDSDISSALSCLAEGDATSTMLDAVLPAGKTALDLPLVSIRQQFFSQKPETDAPPLIIRSLFAPYLDGLSFVHELRKRGGFAEVDRVWQRPPTTTEQVLHLEKYDQNERGIDVAIPSAPEPGFNLWLHDIWGEQSLRLALEEWVDEAKAKDAAAGWGGDRVVVYKKDSRIAVAWHLVMDSDEDARELKQAAKVGLSAPEDELAQSQFVCGKRTTDSPFLGVGGEGRHVFILSAPFDRNAAASPKEASSADCSSLRGWYKTLGTKATHSR